MVMYMVMYYADSFNNQVRIWLNSALSWVSHPKSQYEPKYHGCHHAVRSELVILGIAQPGTLVGTPALYGETVFPFSVEAITDTEVCIKDIKVFRELVLENSEFSREIIEVLNLISMIGINQRFPIF